MNVIEEKEFNVCECDKTLSGGLFTRYVQLSAALIVALLIGQTHGSERTAGASESNCSSEARHSLLSDQALLFFASFDGSAEVVSGPAGIIHGEATFEPGVEGSCITLNEDGLEAGSGQSVFFNDFNEGDRLSTDKGAVMFWFKPHWDGWERNGKRSLVWIQMKDPDRYFAWYRSFSDSAPTALYVSGNDGGVAIDTADCFRNGRWVHLAITWDKDADKIVLYIDGREAASCPWKNKESNQLQQIPKSLTLGKHYADDVPINAEFDELFIFDRPLSENEISTYYIETLPDEVK